MVPGIGSAEHCARKWPFNSLQPFQAFPGVVQQALGQVALSCSSQGSHFQLVFVPAEAGRMLTKGIPFLFHYSCAVLESRDSMSISDDWFLCNQSKKKPP